MFGYPCAFVNGQMFAGLHQENMVLRLSEEDRRQFLQLEGARIFEPMPGRMMREYVVVPPCVLERFSTLRQWGNRSLQFAQSLKPKQAKRRQATRVT